MGSPEVSATVPAVTPVQLGLAFNPFDQNGEFVLASGELSIRRLAVRGIGVNSLSQIAGTGIQIISTFVLARLLNPADFGIVTMVTTFSLLFMNAGGNGFTEAVIQRDKLDDSLASSLFWINSSVGLLLTILFASAGHLMAWFYGDNRLALVAVALSLTIFFTSTSVLHLALLMRGMRFFTVYANSVFARVVSVAVSVALAVAGWGYWALVVGAIAQPFSESIGAWVLCRWRPGRLTWSDATGSMVRFAVKVYGRFSFNYFTRNFDNLLVGWRFNAQALGFYKKAYDLFAMSSVLQSFTNVAVSALSRLTGDPERYKQYLLSAISVWAFLGMAVGGILTLGGRDLIRILLGVKWHTAGEIFTFFGPGFGMMFIYGIHGWIHLSIGRPGRWLRWGIFEFLVTGSMFVLALRWGPSAVAMSWSLSLLLLTFPAIAYAGKPVELHTSAVINSVWRFCLAAVAAGVLTARTLHVFAPHGTLSAFVAAVRLVEISAVFTSIYLVLVCILYGGMAPIRQVLGLLQEMIGRTRTSTRTVERPGTE